MSRLAQVRMPRVTRVRFFFEPCDWWVGVYWSKASRTLYICPIPTLGVKFEMERMKDET